MRSLRKAILGVLRSSGDVSLPRLAAVEVVAGSSSSTSRSRSESESWVGESGGPVGRYELGEGIPPPVLLSARGAVS
ncbi:hypothetical protein AGQ49_25990 [Salmonella enterica subsp. enterica]|nr:hypothetical protein AGQ49_25990 [Salmonella enterica subsp. enterica]